MPLLCVGRCVQRGTKLKTRGDVGTGQERPRLQVLQGLITKFSVGVSKTPACSLTVKSNVQYQDIRRCPMRHDKIMIACNSSRVEMSRVHGPVTERKLCTSGSKEINVHSFPVSLLFSKSLPRPPLVTATRPCSGCARSRASTQSTVSKAPPTRCTRTSVRPPFARRSGLWSCCGCRPSGCRSFCNPLLQPLRRPSPRVILALAILPLDEPPCMSDHATRQSDETCCWALSDNIHEEEGEGEPARRDRDDAVHVDGRVAGEPA